MGAPSLSLRGQVCRCGRIRFFTLAAPSRRDVRSSVVDAETRAYLDEMRDEMRGEMRQLRDRADVLAERLETTAQETRRHFGVVAEGLRHDLQAVAEQVVANTEGIVRLRGEFRSDLDDRFEIVRLAFVDVRHDIAELRTRRSRRSR